MIVEEFDNSKESFCPICHAYFRGGFSHCSGCTYTPSAFNVEAHLPPLETVNHPLHYGGEDNPYEAIKVIETWGLGFCLGNTVKYIARAGAKTKCPIEDLKKARWYLDRQIQELEKNK